MLPRFDGFLAGIRLFARRRAFGVASHELLTILARNQARGLGLLLDLDDIELAILHPRVLFGEITFEQLRTTFAAALQRVSQNPRRPPPKRPG